MNMKSSFALLAGMAAMMSGESIYSRIGYHHVIDPPPRKNKWDAVPFVPIHGSGKISRELGLQYSYMDHIISFQMTVNANTEKALYKLARKNDAMLQHYIQRHHIEVLKKLGQLKIEEIAKP